MGQYSAVHSNDAVKGELRGEMSVNTRVVGEEDKLAFKGLYENMWLYYKTGQMLNLHIGKAAQTLDKTEDDIRRIWDARNKNPEAALEVSNLYRQYLANEMEASFEATWKAIEAGQSIATIAYANGEQKGFSTSQPWHQDRVADGTPVSMTHGMLSIDARSGKTEMQVEGSWTEPAYRRLQVIPKVIGELLAGAAALWKIAGVRWWTFVEGPGTVGNPFTRDLYENLTNPNGQTRVDVLEALGKPLRGRENLNNRVGLEGFTLCLANDPKVLSAYSGQILGKDKLANRTDPDVKFVHVGVKWLRSEEGKAWRDAFAEQYKDSLVAQGYNDIPPDAFDQFLANIAESGQQDKVRLYLVQRGEKGIGYACVRDGMKLPRDEFPYADAAIHLNADGASQEVFDTVLTQMANDALMYNNRLLKVVGEEGATVMKYHPKSVVRVGGTNEDSFAISPPKVPHRHFVLPVGDNEYCRNVPAFQARQIPQPK